MSCVASIFQVALITFLNVLSIYLSSVVVVVVLSMSNLEKHKRCVRL